MTLCCGRPPQQRSVEAEHLLKCVYEMHTESRPYHRMSVAAAAAAASL